MASSDFDDFLKRIMNYCAHAERCTQDVIQKLTAWKAPEEEFDAILEKLRKDKFLDDERYAKSYVADKWKLDLWGRGKIKNGLFQKGIPEHVIQISLDTIEQEIYISGMETLLDKKKEMIRNEPIVSQMKKLLTFGTGRGFEEELIWQWLEKEGLTFDADSVSDDEEDSF